MEWDVRSFANETAQVWLRELLKSITGDSVGKTLEVIDLSEKFVDSQDAERAVAAAEIVAASRGFPSRDLPDEAALWIKAKHYRAGDDLVMHALEVTEKVLKRSELRDLWEGTDSAGKWRHLILELMDRLEEASKTHLLQNSHLMQEVPGAARSDESIECFAGSTNQAQPERSDGGRAAQADVEVMFHQAVEQVSAGNHEQAVATYNRLLECDPNFVIGHVGRGTSFLALGMFEEALADFNNAISLDHDLAEAYNLRAQAFFQTGNIARAIADLTILLKYQPERADAYLMRGLANAEMDRHEKAIEDFSKTLELDPSSVNAYMQRAKAYERLGRFDLAGKDKKQYERLTGITRKL